MSDETRTTSNTGGQKGTKLARFDLIPIGPLTELAQHYGRGARKYADHQWRKGYEWSKSYAALMRHLTDFWAGKDYDVCSNDPDGCSFETAEGEPYEPAQPDTCYSHTGSHHLAAVAWHAFLLLEFKDRFPEYDDRYVPEEKPDALDRLRELLLTTTIPWERLEAAIREHDGDEVEGYGPDLLSKRKPVVTSANPPASPVDLQRQINESLQNLAAYHNHYSRF